MAPRFHAASRSNILRPGQRLDFRKSTEDRTISPDLERFMADRMKGSGDGFPPHRRFLFELDRMWPSASQGAGAGLYPANPDRHNLSFFRFILLTWLLP